MIRDDASPEEDRRWLFEYVAACPERQIVVRWSPENEGCIHVRNRMMQECFSDANTEAVILMDNDIILAPYSLPNLIRFWREHLFYWLVFGVEIGTEIEHLSDFEPYDNNFPLQLHRWCLTLLPRSTYNAVGLIDTGFDRYGYDDTDYIDMCMYPPHNGLVWSTCLAPYVHLHGSHRSWFTNPNVLKGVLNSRRYFIKKWEARGRDMSHMNKKGSAFLDWEHRIAQGARIEDLIEEAKRVCPHLLVVDTNARRKHLNRMRRSTHGSV